MSVQTKVCALYFYALFSYLPKAVLLERELIAFGV